MTRNFDDNSFHQLRRFADVDVRARKRVGGYLISGTPLFLCVLALTLPAEAQLNLGPVTVGAGLRTAYVHNQPDEGEASDRFPLESVRLYVNGPVTEKIKFMFNTEYNSNQIM